LKLLLVLLYFYVLVYIFTISLISFIVRGLAKGLFKGNRDNRRLLALAFYSPVLVEVIIDNKEIVGNKEI
jgi:hypothetical protein